MGIFQMFLPTGEIAESVARRGPWMFEELFVAVEVWKPKWRPEAAHFLETNVWAHLYGIPREYCTEEVGVKLGASIPKCSQLQLRERMRTGERFFRVKMRVDLRKPMKRGVKVRDIDGGVILIVFQFEKAPKYCFNCGLVGHNVMQCQTYNKDRSSLTYGVWMIPDVSFSKLVADLSDRVGEELGKAENHYSEGGMECLSKGVSFEMGIAETGVDVINEDGTAMKGDGQGQKAPKALRDIMNTENVFSNRGSKNTRRCPTNGPYKPAILNRKEEKENQGENNRPRPERKKKRGRNIFETNPPESHVGAPTWEHIASADNDPVDFGVESQRGTKKLCVTMIEDNGSSLDFPPGMLPYISAVAATQPRQTL